MALPQLHTNSPVPGVIEPITTLNVELSEVGLSMEWVAVPPPNLQHPGQFVVLIGSELIICAGSSSGSKTITIVERGAEASTKAAHPAGAKVYAPFTKGSLDNAYLIVPTTAKGNATRTLKSFELTAMAEALTAQLTVGDLVTGTGIVPGTYVVEVKPTAVLISRWPTSAGTTELTFANAGALEAGKVAPISNANVRKAETTVVKLKVKPTTTKLEGLPEWLTALLSIGTEVTGAGLPAKSKITAITATTVTVNNATTNVVEEEREMTFFQVGAVEWPKIVHRAAWDELESLTLGQFTSNKITIGEQLLYSSSSIAIEIPTGTTHNFTPAKVRPLYKVYGEGVGPWTLGGLVGFATGAVVVFKNDTEEKTFTLLHNDPESSTAFNTGTGASIALHPGESVVLYNAGGSLPWVVFQGQALSPWTAPESLGAKVENGAVEPAARIEGQGSRVFLRGSVKIKAGETLVAGETVLTLSANFRPATACEYEAGTLGVMKISTGGVVTMSKNLLTGEVVPLDGLNFGRT